LWGSEISDRNAASATVPFPAYGGRPAINNGDRTLLGAIAAENPS